MVRMLKPLPLRDLQTLRSEFDRCWDWLWASLLEFGPTHSKEQVWDRILEGKAYLWSGQRCVILGEIIDHPIGISSFNYWLQGGNLDELLTMHAGIEQWAIANGCHVALGYGRKGWMRKMAGNWHEVQTLRRKWLKPPPREMMHGTLSPQSGRAAAELETTTAHASEIK
jgi:hypothetical protein